VARPNLFFNDVPSIAQRFSSEDEIKILGRAVFSLKPGLRVEPRVDASGINDLYIMDPASIYPALALGVQSGDRVLDLCAAPGGKTLLLAEGLKDGGELVANELSDQRRARLRAVLNMYVSAPVRTRVKVTNHDGSKWCLYEKDAFDRVLVDAPCSGERHLLANPAELNVWSKARTKNLNLRQYALLVSALQVVKPGGRIVYSTCSISPMENDAVIARLLKKRKGEARVLMSQIDVGEATEHGWALLPDQCSVGPIYFSILERL
jgi:16S rRNA C967 or C1407 C5-methylase (RsmB/RsmF family)